MYCRGTGSFRGTRVCFTPSLSFLLAALASASAFRLELLYFLFFLLVRFLYLLKIDKAVFSRTGWLWRRIEKLGPWYFQHQGPSHHLRDRLIPLNLTPHLVHLQSTSLGSWRIHPHLAQAWTGQRCLLCLVHQAHFGKPCVTPRWDLVHLAHHGTDWLRQVLVQRGDEALPGWRRGEHMGTNQVRFFSIRVNNRKGFTDWKNQLQHLGANEFFANKLVDHTNLRMSLNVPWLRKKTAQVAIVITCNNMCWPGLYKNFHRTSVFGSRHSNVGSSHMSQSMAEPVSLQFLRKGTLPMNSSN